MSSVKGGHHIATKAMTKCRSRLGIVCSYYCCCCSSSPAHALTPRLQPGRQLTAMHDTTPRASCRTFHATTSVDSRNRCVTSNAFPAVTVSKRRSRGAIILGPDENMKPRKVPSGADEQQGKTSDAPDRVVETPRVSRHTTRPRPGKVVSSHSSGKNWRNGDGRASRPAISLLEQQKALRRNIEVQGQRGDWRGALRTLR